MSQNGLGMEADTKENCDLVALREGIFKLIIIFSMLFVKYTKMMYNFKIFLYLEAKNLNLHIHHWVLNV